jgi:hypothetical protein
VSHAAILRVCYGEGPQASSLMSNRESRIQEILPITWRDANRALIILFQDMGHSASKLPSCSDPLFWTVFNCRMLDDLTHKM